MTPHERRIVTDVLARDGLAPVACCSRGVTERPNGTTESCERCRAHELAWQPHYDEQRRLYLAKMAKKT